MRLLLLSLILMLACPVNAVAVPDCDTDKALKGLYSVTNAQAKYKENNNKYEQVSRRWNKRYLYEVDEYVGPNGVGYIARAICEDDGQTYILERHTGPETDRQIATEWTQRRVF